MTSSPTLYFHIETFGCQMNDRDSEIMTQLLASRFQPASRMEEADIVLVNTCSIREKAEQKAFSLLGQLNLIKKKRPHMLIAMVGCVAQQEGKKILSRMPFVDLVMGTQTIYRLPELIDELRSQPGKKIVSVEQKNTYSIPPYLPTMDDGLPHKRFVTIMQGCNNFCTYCVVPYTRGREVSRAFNDIIAEVRFLADQGVKEITLLGQNVNSYGRDLKGEGHNFSELLRRTAEISGVERIRFTSSNPQDLNKELTSCFAELPKLCSHFHLPVQSGSNRVLKMMNRKYDIQTYLELVDLLRQARPDIAITTDIIVGFPGESEEDFQDTMDLVQKVRYHGAFSFKYSDRPHAKSVDFPNKVPEEIKSRRLTELQKSIEDIVLQRNGEYVGQRLEIMVEGPAKKGEGQWSGRSSSNHIVNFTSSNTHRPGDILTLEIVEAYAHSLRGAL